METETKCIHHELIDGAGLGTCKKCGQVRQYNMQNQMEAPVIVKSGKYGATVSAVEEKPQDIHLKKRWSYPLQSQSSTRDRGEGMSLSRSGGKNRTSNRCRRLLRQPNRSCFLCGKKETLHVHHLNWHHEDDTPSNLLILCESCHSAMHKAGYLSLEELEGIKPRAERTPAVPGKR